MNDVDRLKLELASRAIRTMGPASPFWNCTICGAAYLTPIAFEHRPDCLLAGVKPPALALDTRSHHSAALQNGIMRDALVAIADLNHGTTGQAAMAALELVGRP